MTLAETINIYCVTSKKRADGGYGLITRNPEYLVFQANEETRTFARLKTVIDSLSLALHMSFMWEDVPPLFGCVFYIGTCKSGHVTIKESED